MLDTLKLAKAIAEIETGNDNNAIGKLHERSRYQFRESTWKDHCDRPFEEATTNPALADSVAQEYIKWNMRYFITGCSRQPTAFDIAVMWNAGCGFYKRRQFNRSRVPAQVKEYANRVENIYNKL